MKNLGLFIFLMAIAYSASSQTHVVNGSVYAFDNLSLTNIHVEAKKSKAQVSTDSMGNFSIVCFDKDKLTFTGGGFITVTKRLTSNNPLKIKMKFIEGAKNEEIAIGYGYVTREKLQYAISHLSQYNNDFCNYSDIFEIINGKFPGVQVVNENGGKQIIIRGKSSIIANNYALFVVDGVVVSDISFISPTQVLSIDILKDASASVYGSRGANGVVLINTVK